MAFIMKMEVPKGDLRTATNNSSNLTKYGDKLIDGHGRMWVVNECCSLCNCNVLRKVSSNFAVLMEEQESNLMWGKAPKNICGYCSNTLIDLSDTMNTFFNAGQTTREGYIHRVKTITYKDER